MYSKVGVGVLLFIMGMLTCTVLMTQGPVPVSKEVQEGRDCAELILKQCIYLETNEREHAENGFEKLRLYASRGSDFNPGFFEGVQQYLKSYDVKSNAAQAGLNQDGYARFLVLYYFILIYCDQIIRAQSNAPLDIEGIYKASYSLAAQAAYGNVTDDTIQKLQNSVHEFEQIMQEKYYSVKALI